MKRRNLVATIVVALAVVIAAVAATTTHAATKHAAKTVTINLYASGDVNVQSLWQQYLIPGFEKKYRGIKVNFIFS